jgi:hypothetical protein
MKEILGEAKSVQSLLGNAKFGIDYVNQLTDLLGLPLILSLIIGCAEED